MNLAELLAGSSPLLLDGAMGTELASMGLDMGGQSNLSHPDEVLKVHRLYVNAGCDLLTTNTLTMNRIYVETHRVGVDVEAVNLKGVELARSAAGTKGLVLGNISSTGQMLEPYGDFTEAQFHSAFAEQAAYLKDGGVDGFLIETMLDLREALYAVRACRQVSSLPVLATLSFQTTQNGCRTIMGNAAAKAASVLADAGAAAVGANCGELSPEETATVVGIMRETVDVPVLAQPNAGKPRIVGDQTVFDMPPEAFAEGVSQCVTAGARLVGGCCGTTPAHIGALARLVGRKS